MDKTFKDIRHQSYDYVLRDGFLWKRPKKKDGLPLRVINDMETKNQILKSFMIHFEHDIEEFGPPTTKSKNDIGGRVFTKM